MTAPEAVGTTVASVILLLVLVAGAALCGWVAGIVAVRLRRAVQRREGWLRALPWAILLPIAVLFAGGMVYFIVSLVSSLVRVGGR